MFVFSVFFFFFHAFDQIVHSGSKNLVPTLPKMQLPLSDIIGGILSHNIQLPLEPQKVDYFYFHICSSGLQDR